MRAESQDSQQRTHSRQAAANSLVLSWPAVVGVVWLKDVCCCTVLHPSPDIPLSLSPSPSPSPLPFGLLQLRQLLTAEIARWPIYSLIITSSFIHSACIRYRKSGLLGCDDQRLITADGTSANLRHVCTLSCWYPTTAPLLLLLLLLRLLFCCCCCLLPRCRAIHFPSATYTTSYEVPCLRPSSSSLCLLPPSFLDTLATPVWQWQHGSRDLDECGPAGATRGVDTAPTMDTLAPHQLDELAEPLRRRRRLAHRQQWQWQWQQQNHQQQSQSPTRSFR